jgi:hypothetical protein
VALEVGCSSDELLASPLRDLAFIKRHTDAQLCCYKVEPLYSGHPRDSLKCPD